eukprot:TRINITY_DN9120_c0_g1_i2.p1 TRINITY_DN9120_c0_g1~~TRINITY_DN9120_c0_g1_i2.p1  ORF type:complete len:204 (-),score=57.69 TRINITY_DN9120_c0_g1_i2:96-707(-)
MGPSNPSEARRVNYDSLRALYGKDSNQNAVYGSDSIADARNGIQFFFGDNNNLSNTATFGRDVTCGVIKPHAVLSGKAGQIIQYILDAGWQINALELFKMERENTSEFYEVYKGVVPDYSDMVDELSSGPVIALEVKSQGQENVVQAFRNLCGPYDPNIAKSLRPSSLRALFGEDRIKNAIHCTDLEEDAVLEVKYFFKIMQL